MEIGEKYNRLTIIELNIKIDGKKGRYIKYKCDCNNYGYTRKDFIISGHTKSCGCYNKDQYLKSNTTHNSTHTRIYKIWRGIKNRCNNGWNKREIYSKITYDKKWETFEGFYEDMKEGYRDDLTIDRVDNTKGYYKENCKWATYAEQNRNHSRNINLTYKGETMCITDWSIKLNISIGKLRWHIQNKQNTITLEEFIGKYIKAY